jgi:hypothetical protein
MRKKAAGTLVLAIALTGCAPRLAKVVSQGELLRTNTPEVVDQARLEGELERERLTEARLGATMAALSSCAPAVCEAITRGEVVLGMSEPQVLAATRTTPEAWEVRSSGFVTVMTPRHGDRGPRDAVAELAFVNIQGGRVASYTYSEPQGFRTIASPADAGFTGRAAAQAEALLRQGDQYAAAGDLALALQRYDQADVLRPGDAQTTLRIATTLDKQLRPIEAILRYRLFLHQLELERIQAHGEAAARMAEAIARAHERIVVLERR